MNKETEKGFGLAECPVPFSATKSGTRIDPLFHRSTQDTSRSGIMDGLEKGEIFQAFNIYFCIH